MKRLFGTDGVRGVANLDLTPELAFALGRAGAFVLADRSESDRPMVVGRDTRVSGPMLEAALVAGIASTGRNAIVVGVIPTPGIARITTSIEAAGGVVISASHNPVGDNGIKFFAPDGFKLSDADEDAIAAACDRKDLPRPTGLEVGMIEHSRGLVDCYFASLLESGADLSGLRVIVDGAFGAAYAVGPHALRRLGAEVIEMHCEDDGSRINVACGATDLRSLIAEVEAHNTRGDRRAVGVAFDGDADRVMFVDETGAALSGDHVMLILARAFADAGALPGSLVVGTVMSNVGLEIALRAHGIRLERAPVGDRYVLEAMRAGGYRLGGEQSGHIIDLAHNTTGDGPAAAIAILSIMATSKTTLHEMATELTVYPQVLVNVKINDKNVQRDPRVIAAIERVERELKGDGRILVRPSGTEPLIRVMLEGSDQARLDRMANEVAESIQAAERQ